jgi:predicted enzyme related to lactoylglutathione lyase
VINGTHMIIYTRDAEADRAFLRDVLRYPHVDAGDGWLIFALPPAELAFHPTQEKPSHQLYFMCDDLRSTLESFGAYGVEVVTAVTEQRWGLTTTIRLPGGSELGLYEPRHPRAIEL